MIHKIVLQYQLNLLTFYQNVLHHNNPDRSLALFKSFCSKCDDYFSNSAAAIIPVDTLEACVNLDQLGKSSGTDDSLTYFMGQYRPLKLSDCE